MLTQHLERWSNVETLVGQRLMLAKWFLPMLRICHSLSKLKNCPEFQQKKRSVNAGLMRAERRRRWALFKPALFCGLLIPH